MSTYKSCWSFSILNMHELVETTVCHSQIYTLPDQMNWHFVQIFMASNFKSKFHALDTDDINQKTSLFSVQGQYAWYCFMVVVLLFYVIWVRYTKYSVSAQTPITTLATHLLHNFIVNLKYTRDWSNRKPHICLSFNFWRQYSANGTCLTSVNMQKYMSPSPDFFERVKFSLT